MRFSVGDRSKPAEERNPRLWVRCLIGATAECGKDQTVRCRDDWRLLIPLWRTDPLYHELKCSHQEYEGVHGYWRKRYKVGADDFSIRPKARGIGWHRLRPTWPVSSTGSASWSARAGLGPRDEITETASGSIRRRPRKLLGTS